MPYRSRPLSVLCAAVSIATALAACGFTPTPFYQQKQFDVTASPYTRTFHAKPDTTCEVTHRALLSQGYVSSSPRAGTIDGSKNFQPNDSSYVVISSHVMRAGANVDGTSSTVYVSVVQGRYALKKTDTLTGVGLSILSSVSLPIGSGNGLMVKVASKTIPARVFYERYFNLVGHLLKIDPARKDHKVVKTVRKEHVAPLSEPAPTPQSEPMKTTTPMVPTPVALSVPMAASASAPASAPTSAPASAPAAVPALRAPAEAAPALAPAATTPAVPAAASNPVPTFEPTSSTTGGAN